MRRRKPLPVLVFRDYDPVPIAEAALIIRCHPENVRYLINKGVLPAHRANGKCWLLDRAIVWTYRRRRQNRRSRAEALEEGKLRE